MPAPRHLRVMTPNGDGYSSSAPSLTLLSPPTRLTVAPLEVLHECIMNSSSPRHSFDGLNDDEIEQERLFGEAHDGRTPVRIRSFVLSLHIVSWDSSSIKP